MVKGPNAVAALAFQMASAVLECIAEKWAPVFREKMHDNKQLDPRFDSIKTHLGLEERA
jgi:hypothetical protein